MAKKQGFKNKYEIKGDITEIEIINRKGNKYISIIDTEDLQKLIDLDYCWYVWKDNSNGSYYVRSTIYKGISNGKPKNNTVYLHKIIYGNTDIFIDHINCNSLDNRKLNLRDSTNKDNLTNRKRLNKNNKTGYRNICLINNKWVIQLQINGENKKLGSFDYNDLDNAILFAESMRKKYYNTDFPS